MQILRRTWWCVALAVVAGVCGLRAGEKKPAAAVVIPAAVQRPVDFAKDVEPILQNSCVQCHAGGKSKGGLKIETRETIGKGGDSGPAVVEGDGGKSLMIQLVSGADPDRIMPAKGRRLTAEEIGVLRAWIDQGVKWPKGFVMGRGVPQAPLEPRRVELPAGGEGENPIDRILRPYFGGHHVDAARAVDDRTYARRVWLDTIGLLPPPSELEAFVADKSADKRSVLVRRLLDDHSRYATHWLSFWNDLLRNDYKGTGYIDGGRKQITPWLYRALVSNEPFDRFVRDLVTGANGADGFTKGIVWRGVVNAAQTPQMQAAQNISQVFMGVNLKCASCHDSFISEWKLDDSYGLAGIYAEAPLEMERCSQPLGRIAKTKFLYPQLGEVDPAAPRERRLNQLADAILSPKNGRLTRTVVNRLWKKFMGRGIVEPVDEMDNRPWNADLLDWLANDLAGHGYDLKHTMEVVLTSKAYQMPAVGLKDVKDETGPFVFAGPVVRRMTGEEFEDALAAVTGVWHAKNEATLAEGAKKYKGAKWIWSEKAAAKAAAPGTIYLRKEVELGPEITDGVAVTTCDNEFRLMVNGKEAGRSIDWKKPVSVDLKPYLVEGKNVVAVVAVNTTDKPSAAGFWFNLAIKYRKAVDKKKAIEVNSDATWRWSKEAPKGWEGAGFDDATWAKAVELGDVSIKPWSLAEKLPGEQVVEPPAEVRASLCTADPLMVAMGRPNREQVVTDRPSVATTLEALEMTNGGTLADMMRKGAGKLAGGKGVTGEHLIDQVYLKALGRLPVPEEKKAAEELVGSPVKEEGVEDLLWVVAMLPEFQLIR